jgi:hypothetical protein
MAKAAPSGPKFRIKLNLLHPNEIPLPLPARFLKWLITYGRYIVILTEVIVVAAFLYRFKLDADLDQLKRNINKDLPYIEGLSANEAVIKQTQQKLAIIQQVYTLTPDWEQILTNIAREQPRNIQVTSINFEAIPSVKDVKFKVSGQTPSNNDLAVFIRRLKDKKGAKNQNSFKDISLDSVTFDQSQLIFSLTGVAKSEI